MRGYLDIYTIYINTIYILSTLYLSPVPSFLYELDAITPREDDLYIAYLPLAHVLELIGESMMIMSGVAIGYRHHTFNTQRN